MTPEQIAEAMAWAKSIVQTDDTDPAWRRAHLARALLAEHERAERYAASLAHVDRCGRWDPFCHGCRTAVDAAREGTQ